MPRFLPSRILCPHRLLVAVLLAALAIAASTELGFAQSEPETDEPLRVVTKSIEPFVFVEGDNVIGFSIDLWEEVASEMGVDYEYLIVDTVEEQLQAVERGRADLAIAAITITEEREARVDFSLPYYRSGLGILANVGTDTPYLDALLRALTRGLLIPIVGLLLLLIAVGVTYWLLEHRRNPEFAHMSPLQGIWEGIWWAAVTVTTVGYGDRTPRSAIGRLLGMVWMFTGLFLVANFTATVTANLTASQLTSRIEGPEDLPGAAVISIAGTTAEEWLNEQLIPHRRAESFDIAFNTVASGEADALVFDYPVLLFSLATRSASNLVLAGEPFRAEWYGVAFPNGSAIREDLNRALLTVVEDGRYEDLHLVWFGATGGR